MLYLSHKGCLNKDIARQVATFLNDTFAVLDLDHLLGRDKHLADVILKLVVAGIGFKIFLYLELLAADSLKDIPFLLQLCHHLTIKGR